MDRHKEVRISRKYWTRRAPRFGFGLQPFGNSNFGSSRGFGTRFGFGHYGFGQVRCGSPGPTRGPIKSRGLIDSYQLPSSRLQGLVISARGIIFGEEIYWPKNDNRTGCIPRPTKVASHYVNLPRAKLNSLVHQIYHYWKKLPEEEKQKYNRRAALETSPMAGNNLFFKEIVDSWGFGKGGFGREKFGGYHFPLHFFGFGTVAFGQGAFGSHYPAPRRMGLGLQPFGESRFGGRVRVNRRVGEFCC